jgi:hypothetical protein
MTGLGATLYFGGFGLAALWLYLTSERFRARVPQDQGQRPEFSNSINVAAGSLGSSPFCASQSSQK